MSEDPPQLKWGMGGGGPQTLGGGFQTLPVPPKTCMSTCSSKYIRHVLTWGSSPSRKTRGKQRVNTGGVGGTKITRGGQ